MTPITTYIYLCIAALAILSYLEPKFRFILYIGSEWVWLFIRKIPLRIKLEWEIFLIKRDKDRYLKMAQKILEDLHETDTN